MTITVYGIANCDTVKKARKWLDARGVSYNFHDFKKGGLTQERAAEWIAELGVEKVLNKRGTTWRKLDPAIQAGVDADSAPALLASQSSLVKRPVIDLGEIRLIGFDKAVQADLETLLD
ncbi:arsenate reductase [uncultured Nisaea sp.]|uniref:arsenate reductase n=1 Tax=uncultured Nisaea sp. TaxID=538215 RepID=UPI0030EBEF18